MSSILQPLSEMQLKLNHQRKTLLLYLSGVEAACLCRY